MAANSLNTQKRERMSDILVEPYVHKTKILESGTKLGRLTNRCRGPWSIKCSAAGDLAFCLNKSCAPAC